MQLLSCNSWLHCVCLAISTELTLQRSEKKKEESEVVSQFQPTLACKRAVPWDDDEESWTSEAEKMKRQKIAEWKWKWDAKSEAEISYAPMQYLSLPSHMCVDILES